MCNCRNDSLFLTLSLPLLHCLLFKHHRCFSEQLNHYTTVRSLCQELFLKTCDFFAGLDRFFNPQVVLSRDSLSIISHVISFVKNFFKFFQTFFCDYSPPQLCKSLNLPVVLPSLATACPLYHHFPTLSTPFFFFLEIFSEFSELELSGRQSDRHDSLMRNTYSCRNQQVSYRILYLEYIFT